MALTWRTNSIPQSRSTSTEDDIQVSKPSPSCQHETNTSDAQVRIKSVPTQGHDEKQNLGLPEHISIPPSSLDPEGKYNNIPQPAIPPPDVGIQPWLQVLAGHFLMFNTWGLVVSYGAFQTYYTSPASSFTNASNPSAIAWIGSIQNTLLLVGAALSGKYFDAGYYRYMVSVGSCLVVFGTLMTSLVNAYWQAVLAQGACIGLGMGMLLVPSVGLVSTWFERRRGFAVGIVSSGASLAGIVVPISLRHTIPSVGFGWAVRVVALMSLVTLLVSNVLIKQRLPPRPRRGSRFIEYQALRQQREFAFWIAGQFVTYFGFFGFYNYVETWAESVDLETGGFPLEYLLPVLNAASILGRLIPCFIADYIGPLNTQTPSLLLCGLLVLVWIPCKTFGGVLAITILYGFFSGAVIAMPPAVVASMTKDLREFGGRMGVMFLALACSSLVGPPVMGAIIETHGGNYDAARVYAGSMLVGGASLLGWARLKKTGLNILVRA